MDDGMMDEAQRTREKLQALAWWLDASIRLPGGFRIGVDAILGLVPLLGDILGLLISGYIVVQAARLRVPHSVLLRMLLNVGVEGLVGQAPLLGDVFDATWKANLRNVRLLEEHLDQPTTPAAITTTIPAAANTAANWRWFAVAASLLVLFIVLTTVLSVLALGWLWYTILQK